ncbi:phage tail tape measure C-terminal domain-containing protein [Rickettsia endosymbiont of Cardiosporidium cionae]|uniref:phage tail tape measure C-terminal domain-containing protein n=1 Tax=Rickettsia endosymbiont of Cardiosporidium cionae TaxID=2777155 RepID=UPI0018955D35|nr:phage tail tape measure C-terminal domain-containing protein [Rickettsia endosymbiont of Cardiosporidium cionae]KAF8818081.1 hypothetical protein IHI24_000880 [Rickettsia endosymbiont of Cardiosporidium cionae]
MAEEKRLTVRLQARGGNQIKSEFKKLGDGGKQAFNRIDRASKVSTKNLQALNRVSSTFNNTLSRAASLAGAYLGLQGLTSAFRGVIEINKSFQTLNASITSLLGSTEASQLAFRQLEAISDEFSVPLSDLLQSFIRLRSAGLQPTSEQMIAFANIAAATQKTSIDFATAIADTTKGSIDTLGNFGIIATRVGDNINLQFQGMTRTVENSAEAISKAVTELSQNALGGGLEAQANTVAGAFVRIQNNVEKLARNIGASGLNEAMNQVASKFADVVASGGQMASVLGSVLSRVIVTLGSVLSGLIANLDLVVQGITAFAAAFALQTVISATSTAIAAASAAMAFFTTTTGAATGAVTAFKVAVSAIGKSTALIAALGLAAFKGFEFVKSFFDEEERAVDAKENREEFNKELEKTNNLLQQTATPIGGINDITNPVNDALTANIEAREKDLENFEGWKDNVSKGFKDVEQTAKDTSGDITSTFSAATSNLENSLVDFVTKGQFSFKSFANSIISDIARIAVRQAIITPLVQGVTGAIGGLFSASPVAVAHTGGIIGQDSFSKRAVNPSLFAGAKRFHEGGLVRGEVPIIARRGEAVLTPGQLGALGGTQKPEVNVRVNIQNNASGASINTETRRDNNGDLEMEIIIEQIESSLGQNIASGRGLGPIFERVYGVSRGL